MAGDSGATPHDGDWPITNPWPALLTGLGMSLGAVLWHALLGDAWMLPRVFLIVAGVLAAGCGVAIRLQGAGQDLEDRFVSACILGLASFVALLGNLALKEEWDSTCLLFRVLVGVALGGAALVLLPSVARRVVLVLGVAAHFLGIFTAIASIPPGGLNEQPWVTNQLWNYAFRDYLLFMYLNNAYHFYSPNPGPPDLIWFRVEYADGSYRWIKIPDREAFRTRLEYQRRLGLTTSIAATDVTTLLDPRLLETIKMQRISAGNLRDIPFATPGGNNEFQPPALDARLMLESYTQHIGHAYPSLDNPALEVTGIRVYRVVHRILLPKELADPEFKITGDTKLLGPSGEEIRGGLTSGSIAEGAEVIVTSEMKNGKDVCTKIQLKGQKTAAANEVGGKIKKFDADRKTITLAVTNKAPGVPPLDPYDPTTYLLFYEGEYDKDGKLKPMQDPFRYWQMPVQPGKRRSAPADFDGLDTLGMEPAGS